MEDLNFKQRLLRVIVVIFLITFCLTFVGCGTTQHIDKCCEKDAVVYLDELEDGTTSFTNLNYSTIRLEFKPLKPRLYWGYSYGYWGSRPLWMDFDFYYGNYYSYYDPYYSFSYFHRPWNWWNYYTNWWSWNDSWYQGPFNNSSYNIVYNASRRGNLTSNIKNRIQINRIENSNERPVNNHVITEWDGNNQINWYSGDNKPVINNRPSYNNNSRPSYNNNNSRPNYNNSKPSNNSRPVNNSRINRKPR
jgi:hypothetical protein